MLFIYTHFMFNDPVDGKTVIHAYKLIRIATLSTKKYFFVFNSRMKLNDGVSQ